MARLDQMAKVIRSKNAGPFCLTLDVLFDDPSTYEQVQRSGAITRETMASLYRQPAENVEVFYARAALAIKSAWLAGRSPVRSKIPTSTARSIMSSSTT